MIPQVTQVPISVAEMKRRLPPGTRLTCVQAWWYKGEGPLRRPLVVVACQSECLLLQEMDGEKRKVYLTWPTKRNGYRFVQAPGGFVLHCNASGADTLTYVIEEVAA